MFRSKVPIVSEEDRAKFTSPQTQMAVALARTGKPFYEGTVFGAEKAKRRARGKRQRLARKQHR